jgi:ligand-binding sensor domain-containing protein
LFLDEQETVWLGTSQGRVLARSDGQWTLEAQFDAQVSGIAIEAPGRVWVSTGDGLRRLDRQADNSWQGTAYRTYYQGQPAFVSGGYAPGLDAERLWGYVDGVYIPYRVKVYATFVISTEHGLFSWGGYHGVWHHFLPHCWGGNSAWLDTRDLIPHRRPTCMIEDATSNLWVGTEGDDLVRFNAPAREYFRRDPEHNQKVGTEFNFFGTNDVGCDLNTVARVVTL